jgi:hypothetical protein
MFLCCHSRAVHMPAITVCTVLQLHAIGSLSAILTCSDRLETCQKFKTNVSGIRKITFVVANQMPGPRGYGCRVT